MAQKGFYIKNVLISGAPLLKIENEEYNAKK